MSGNYGSSKNGNQIICKSLQKSNKFVIIRYQLLTALLMWNTINWMEVLEELSP